MCVCVVVCVHNSVNNIAFLKLYIKNKYVYMHETVHMYMNVVHMYLYIIMHVGGGRWGSSFRNGWKLTR